MRIRRPWACGNRSRRQRPRAARPGTSRRIAAAIRSALANPLRHQHSVTSSIRSAPRYTPSTPIISSRVVSWEAVNAGQQVLTTSTCRPALASTSSRTTTTGVSTAYGGTKANGVLAHLHQSTSLDKPIIAGEVGIEAGPGCLSVAARALVYGYQAQGAHPERRSRLACLELGAGPFSHLQLRRGTLRPLVAIRRSSQRH